MLDTLQQTWYALSNIGVHAHLPHTETRKVRLVNQVMVLTIPIHLTLLILNLVIQDWFGALAVIFFLSAMSMGLLFNHFRWYNVNRWYLFLSLSLGLLLLGWLYGPGVGLEGPFIVICMGIMLLFDGRPGYQFFLVTLVIGGYFFCQWGFTWHVPSMKDELNPFAIYFIYVGSLIGALVILRTYLGYTRRYEDQLQGYLHSYHEQNKALKIANQDLEQFAVVASHDLKTPLRSITSFLGLIERRMEPEARAEVQEYLNIAKSNARHMFILVDDILEFSRLDGKSEVSEVDLFSMACKVRDRVLPTVSNSHSILVIQPLPWIWAMPTHIELLFQNLIENAFKYNDSDEPELEISGVENESFVSLRFVDNGIGIPAQYQTHIFEMFARLHPQHQYAGTGVGLAICRKIVQNHGGEINVLHSSPQGTTIEVRLPRRGLKLEKGHYEISMDTF